MFGNIYGLSRPFGIPRKFRRFSRKFKNLQKRGVFFKEYIYIMDIGPQVAVEPRKGHMEKEFHVLIVTRRKDGSSAVYNYCHLAENRLAIFNYFLKKFDPDEVETLTILEEREA